MLKCKSDVQKHKAGDLATWRLRDIKNGTLRHNVCVLLLQDYLDCKPVLDYRNRVLCSTNPKEELGLSRYQHECKDIQNKTPSEIEEIQENARKHYYAKENPNTINEMLATAAAKGEITQLASKQTAVSWLYEEGCMVENVPGILESLKVTADYIAITSDKWALMPADIVSLDTILRRGSGCEPRNNRQQITSDEYLTKCEQ